MGRIVSTTQTTADMKSTRSTASVTQNQPSGLHLQKFFEFEISGGTAVIHFRALHSADVLINDTQSKTALPKESANVKKSTMVNINRVVLSFASVAINANENDARVNLPSAILPVVNTQKYPSLEHSTRL